MVYPLQNNVLCIEGVCARFEVLSMMMYIEWKVQAKAANADK